MEIEACKSCGRWDGVITYSMTPYSLPAHTSEPLDVLVVGEYPSTQDDERGIPFQDDPHKDLIAGPLARTPWHVKFTTLARCAGPKPSMPQLSACRELHFDKLIKQQRPKVIWALGAQVAKSLLNSSLTMDKLKSLGVSQYEDIPLLILEKPSQHSKYKSKVDGGKDLRPEYKKKFELTHKIIHGEFVSEEFEYELITDPSRAIELGEFLRNDCYPAIGYDTEAGIQADTNVAEQSERVSYLTSGFSSLCRLDNKYYTYCVDHEDWDRSAVYKMLYACLKGKMPVATQAFFDFAMAWWQGGFNVFPAVLGWQDIHLLGWAQNQTQARNGLETQLIDYLGWANYKGEMDEWKARLEKQYEPDEGSLLRHVDYRHMKWDNVDKFRKYQAKDAFGTIRLWHERYQTQNPEALVPEEKFNLNGYRLSLSYIESLSYMSRHGIPINLHKLDAFREVSRKKVEHYQTWLDQHPITRAVLGDRVNVKSTDQMHKLFVACGLEARSKTEKTNKNQVNQDELMRQSDCTWDKSGAIVRGSRADLISRDRAIRDYFYGVLQCRIHRDKQSKTDSLRVFALPSRSKEYVYRALTPDGDQLHWLHPFYKIGRMEGGERGDGGVNTGRISSVWPSAGNIEQDNDLRDSFEAPSGWVVCEWDQSAIEPRVFAYLAGEERWQQVFILAADEATAKDPAADIYRLGWTDYQHTLGFSNYTPADVCKETERPQAKILILRLCYDSSPHGITRDYGIPIALSTGFAEAFWAKNTKLQAFAYAARKDINYKRGWVQTCQGRRAQYPLYNSYRFDDDIHYNLPLWKLQKECRISEADAEKFRAGMNSLIQGSAADITLTAVNDVCQHLAENKITWMIPFETVHDNIACLVRETHIQEADRLVNSIMTDPVRIQDKWSIKIPFPRTGPRIMRTGFKVGPSKGRLKEVR